MGGFHAVLRGFERIMSERKGRLMYEINTNQSKFSSAARILMHRVSQGWRNLEPEGQFSDSGF